MIDERAADSCSLNSSSDNVWLRLRFRGPLEGPTTLLATFFFEGASAWSWTAIAVRARSFSKVFLFIVALNFSSRASKSTTPCTRDITVTSNFGQRGSSFLSWCLLDATQIKTKTSRDVSGAQFDRTHRKKMCQQNFKHMLRACGVV